MAKNLALTFGVIFVLVGLLGFISNPIVGSHGFFVTDALHNIVHLLIGIVLLAMAGSAPAMSMNIFGVVYLLLAIVGFIQGGTGKLIGLVAYNSADNWLHLVLGIVLLACGMMYNKKMSATTPSPMV